MRKIIAVVNQKGGVAKTTTAINLGAALAKQDQKILLIDIDPQANLTTGMGIKEADKTIYKILKSELDFQDCIIESDFKNIDIIPSNIKLANAELELSGEVGRETLLKEAFQKTEDLNYDYLILDTNPSLGLLTINSLTLAGELIIPVEPSIFALDGIKELINIINLIRRKMNSNLEIMGVLLTRVDARTNIAKEFEKDLREMFKDKIFNTIIHQNVDIAKAQANQKPVIDFNERAKSSQEYIKLAEEVLTYYE